MPQSEAPWGCPAGAPPPAPRTTGHLADLKKCHQQLMASVKREDNPHLGVTEPDISFKKLSKGQLLGYVRLTCQTAPPVETGLEMVSKKHSPSSISSKLRQSVSKQKEHCPFLL